MHSSVYYRSAICARSQTVNGGTVTLSRTFYNVVKQQKILIQNFLTLVAAVTTVSMGVIPHNLGLGNSSVRTTWQFINMTHVTALVHNIFPISAPLTAYIPRLQLQRIQILQRGDRRAAQLPARPVQSAHQSHLALSPIRSPGSRTC